MNPMTEEELQRWLQVHGGYAGQKQNERTTPATHDLRGNETPGERVVDSITYEAADGATITVKERPVAPAGTMGPDLAETASHYEKVGETRPDPTRAGQSPSQAALTQAQTTKAQNDNSQEVRDNNERSWNQTHTNEGGSGLPETHLERAAREAKEQEAKRLQAQTDTAAEASRRATAAQDEQNRQTGLSRTEQAREHDVSAGLTASAQAETARHNQVGENAPHFLSTADDKSPYVVTANPTTGKLTQEANPNYDAVKAAAEQKRAEFAAEIAGRRMTLDEAQAQYTQWFDTNVKGPLMLAQEARAKAEEQRQALDAEERRKQFAADFGLRKATLGESASQRATNAEISLLPYRAGPTESAEMSSAINSLAAGGKVGGPDASAGVNFTAGAFQFAAPDFDKIAKNAAHQVLSGLTDYRPSSQSYATGDYSGVPAVNLSGGPSMPAVGAPYQYTPTPLPAPSPGNAQ